MSSSQQSHVEVRVRAPSKDNFRRPVHPRIKDGHDPGQKGRLQRRAAVVQASVPSRQQRPGRVEERQRKEAGE